MNRFYSNLKNGIHKDIYVVQGKPTKEDLKNIVQTVPYYNQSESYTLFEIKGYYIPKVDEIKKIISQEKHGFGWCKDFYLKLAKSTVLLGR